MIEKKDRILMSAFKILQKSNCQKMKKETIKQTKKLPKLVKRKTVKNLS